MYSQSISLFNTLFPTQWSFPIILNSRAILSSSLLLFRRNGGKERGNVVILHYFCGYVPCVCMCIYQCIHMYISYRLCGSHPKSNFVQQQKLTRWWLIDQNLAQAPPSCFHRITSHPPTYPPILPPLSSPSPLLLFLSTPTPSFAGYNVQKWWQRSP